MKYYHKILIVDDNKENLTLVGNILDNQKYNIALASSGKQALAILEDDKFELILLDIMMPEMDGFEVCKILKSQQATKDIPVIFLTAITETKNIVKGFELGGVDYITKPFFKEELLSRVKSHLDLYISKKQIIEYNRNRDFIYSIIAHDIKSPFNKTSQLLALLKEGDINPASNEFAELITLLDKQNTNALKIINNLLEWTEILRNDSLNISEEVVFNTVNFALASCISSIKEKKISITNKVPENTKALFEKKSLEVALRNIISNAVKFTPEGGSITLFTEEYNDTVLIGISDTGMGIKQENIDKILNKNEYFTTAGTNNEKGSGMGLPIVNEFIKRSNGKLIIKSDGLKGSTFSILLNR